MSESPELYVTLGRIEADVRNMRESQDRMEKNFDAQVVRINEIELDVKELKTQRDDKSNKIAIAISTLAAIAAAISIFVP